MKQRRSVIGAPPGSRTLLQAIENAETIEEKARLYYSSPLISREDKQHFTDTLASYRSELLRHLPFRRMVRS